MGIYGFLSAAYQETAAKAGNIEAEIALVEVKRDNVKEQLIVYNEEKTSINGAVADLRKGLSNNVIQYKDRETGEIITTTSSNTRRALEKQLDQAIERQTQINTKVDELNEKIFEYETEIVEIRTSDAVSSELGPLKYLSGLTGTPMDKIINWLLLTIIFVFDPLAIALVVAANFAFEQIRPKTRKNLYGETVKVKPNPEPLYEEDYEVKMSKPDDLEYGKPYTMEEVSEAFKKMDEQIEEEAKEEKFADSYTHTGYASEEIKELEDQLNKLPKTKKLGPKGRKALTKKLNELKNKKNDDDDLIIRY
jgi:predicted  nucleic acid-binding Zn-ribbon protein